MSKSALLGWLRCPYAWWLFERRLISHNQMLTDAERERLERGVQFERTLTTDGARVAIRPDRLPDFIASHPDSTLAQQPVKNPELELIGRIDRLVIANGALYPVEIKGHRRVRRSDVLELAFYWMALAALRTLDVPPRGVVVLRRDGGTAEEWVDLEPSHFARVDRLVADVRASRLTDVPPHGCGRCPVCKGQVELRPGTPPPSEMTRALGIGPVRATQLERVCSISTLDALSSCDPVTVAAELRAERVWVSVAQVDDWRMHSLSLSLGAPVRRDPADPFPISGEYLAVDLEYDSEMSFVWLVGAAVVRAGTVSVEQRWVTSAADEVDALQWLLKLVKEHAHLPVVTWYGSSAELIILEEVAERHGLNLHGLVGRHVDLHYWMVGNIRLPVVGAGLKELAPFFGLDRASSIGDGLAAVMAWRRTATENDPALRERLMQYNREDLDSLIDVVEGLRRLSTDPDVTSVPRAAAVTRERDADGDEDILAGIELTLREADEDFAWPDEDAND